MCTCHSGRHVITHQQSSPCVPMRVARLSYRLRDWVESMRAQCQSWPMDEKVGLAGGERPVQAVATTIRAAGVLSASVGGQVRREYQES